MGVPQGIILSANLFILKINSIADVIPFSFEKSVFIFLMYDSLSVVLLEIWL